jgi:nucleoside phosphorylase
VTQPKDTLLLAAHELELAPLAHELAEQPHLAARCATAAVGVGIASAGAGAARALSEHAPARVVLLGSAGVYPGCFAFVPGELTAAARIELVDAARVAKRAQVPAPMTTEATTSRTLTDSLCAIAKVARRVAVATTAAITVDDTLANELATTGCEVENLEALPVALACAAVGVPFAALLGITNEVGANGRAQWHTHHDNAANACAQALLAWLASES